MLLYYRLIVLTLFVLLATSCDKQLTEQEYVERMKRFSSEHDYETALIETKNALQAFPERTAIRLQAGRFYYQIGLFEQSARFLKSALQTNEQHLLDVDRYFDSLLMIDDLKNLEAGLLQSKFNALNQTYLIRLYLRNGQQDKVKSLFDALSSVKSNDLNTKLARFEHQFIFSYGVERRQLGKQKRQALAYLESLNDVDLMDRRVVIETAKLLSDLGQKAQALKLFKTVFETSPKYPNILLYIIQLSFQLTLNEQAEHYFELAKSFGEKRPIMDQFEALLAYQKQDYESAQMLATRAMQEGVNTRDNRIVAGMSAFLDKKYEQAYRLLLPLTETLSPQDPILRILTILELQAEQLDKAADLFADMTINSVGDLNLAHYLIFHSDSSKQGQLKDALDQKVTRTLDSKKALFLYGQIARSFPETDDASLRKALGLLQELTKKDQSAVAKKSILDWSQQDPENGIAQTLFALSLWDDGNSQKTTQIFSQLIQKNPRNLIALQYALMQQQSAQNWPKIVDIATQILTYDKNQLASFNLLLAASLQMKTPPTIDLYSYVVASQNERFRHTYLQYLLARKAWLQIDQILAPLEAQFQWPSDYWLTYIESAKQQGLWQQAEHRLDLALQAFPQSTDIQLLKVENQLRQGHLKLAETGLNSLTLEAKKRPFYHELRGNLATLNKRYEAAEAAYLTSYEIEPNKAILFKINKVGELRGDQALSLRLSKEYASANIKDDHFRLQAFSWFANQYTQAALEFVDVPTLLPTLKSNWQLSNNVAWYYYQIGHIERAKYFIKFANALAPNEKSVINTNEQINNAK